MTALRKHAALMLALLAVTVFYIQFNVRSTGTCSTSLPVHPADVDSIIRSMSIQRALAQPYWLVDPWVRPLGVIPYLPVTVLALDVQKGFRASKALSCAYSILACFFIAMAAGAMNIRYPWIALLALATQPIICETSAGVTPETIFVMVFALALWCHAKGWVRAEAVCYGLLPLARLENIVLLAPAAAYLVWKARRPCLLPILAAPTILWYLIGAWALKDLFWLMSFARIWVARYTGYLDHQMQWTTGGWDPFHYVYLAPFIFGAPVLLLAFPRILRKWDLLTVYFLVLFGVHACLKGHPGHVGCPRYIAPLAPLLALFAAQGIECLEWGLHRLHAGLIRYGAVAVLALNCAVWCRPLYLEHPETEVRLQAAQYLLENAPNAPYLTAQAWLDFHMNRNWCDHPRLSQNVLDGASLGTYVLWDQCASHTSFGISYEAINSDPCFQKVIEFPLPGWDFGPRTRGYRITIFKKVPPSPVKMVEKIGDMLWGIVGNQRR